MSVFRSRPAFADGRAFPCVAQPPGPASAKAPVKAATSGADGDKADAKELSGSQIAKKVLTQPERPAAMWDDLFTKEAVSAGQLADAVAYLHEHQHYNVAVEGMLSAIRNDQAVPWIYDVLVFEMKLAGRPKEEISRVLQSRLDFSTSDIRQMLLTAALLARFEAWDEAIGVCREATEINPELSEAWLMGRSISDKADIAESRVFFRCGILRYVWGKDFERHHAEAKTAIEEIVAQCDRNGNSELGQSFLASLAAAASVDLEVQLNWVGAADLDLLVTEPGGEKCSYKRRFTANGGRLVREDGVSEAPASKHYESYVCHTAPPGDYELAVRFVLGKAVAGTATLEIIQHKGTASEKRTTKKIILAKEDVVIKTTLANGRAVVKQN